MIDSSGRRGLRADGTVLDLLPVGRTTALIGGTLVALFVLVKPEASQGLGTAGRTVFWVLHVGLGLGALRVASRWLGSGRLLPDGVPAAVIATGVAGVVIAAPGFVALDALFAPHVVDVDREPVVEPLLARVLGEVTELAPWFMTAWLLINLPVLLPRPAEAGARLDDAVSREASDDDEGVDDAAPIGRSSATDGGAPATPPLALVGTGRAGSAGGTAQIDARGQRFLATLPGIVGTDVVAVASDLHYLNVWTVAGRTTVLGNLRDVVDDLGERGMQVHRGHWVAHAHVRRIVGTASDAACLLSNELRVPVSRRRWKAVREQYGRGVVHAAEGGGARRSSRG